MSHYTEIETEFTDRDCLVKALTDLGYSAEQIEIHDEAKTLYGYHGDARAEKANVIIRRANVGSASNDVGWIKDPQTGRYRAVISDFDSRTHFNHEKQADLKGRYSYHKTVKTLKQKGYRYTETKRDGQTFLTVNLD